MNVLLVEPPKLTWELMGGNCISPPLGLAQLAAVLEKEGIGVNILDCNASGINWPGLEEYIGELQPDIVGATALTPFFFQSLQVVEITKKANPEIITILGGPHVTFTAEETLYQHPEVNIIVRGEGEKTLAELVHCLRKRSSLSQVRGIAFRNDSQIMQTPPQSPVDVNRLPLPAYHLLPMEK